jgi:(p)ppGpp synthase/HD superfamily hydrolase
VLLLKRALDQAAVWHTGQLRKYPSVSVPYVSHVAGVVAILARHGFDAEVQAAGALHDVLEDCGVTPEELSAMFGARVCELVRLSSEEGTKDISWEERKRLYVEKFPQKPWEAQAITLADKIDNFASIIECAERFGNPWAMFKRGKAAQLERFRALEAAARVLPGHPLIDEYVAMLTVMAEVPEPDPLA